MIDKDFVDHEKISIKQMLRNINSLLVVLHCVSLEAITIWQQLDILPEGGDTTFRRESLWPAVMAAAEIKQKHKEVEANFGVRPFQI